MMALKLLFPLVLLLAGAPWGAKADRAKADTPRPPLLDMGEPVSPVPLMGAEATKSTPALFAELRRVARWLHELQSRSAIGDEESADLFAEAEDLGAVLASAASGLENAFQRASAVPSGGQPTHFVGLRMPPKVRSRLERVQALLLKHDKGLKKAAVPLAKAHVTLFVTKVDVGRLEDAQEALAAAAKAWLIAEGSSLQRLAIRGLDSFSRNGVIFAKMGPLSLLQALRAHLLLAFTERGFAEKEENEGDKIDEGRQKVTRAERSDDNDEDSASSLVVGAASDDSSSEADVSNDEDETLEAGAEMSSKQGGARGRQQRGGGRGRSATATTSTAARGARGRGRGAASSPNSSFQPHVTIFKSSQAGRGRGGKKRAVAAKKAIVNVAKDMSDARLDFSLGDMPILTLELVDMRNTQADGYYEVLAAAVLGSPPKEEDQAGKFSRAAADKDEDGKEFESILMKLLRPQELASEEDTHAGQTTKAKKKGKKSLKNEGLHYRRKR